MGKVIQDWVESLSLMQQTVLLSAIRGPDGIGKFHKVKPLIRWYRRCLLVSAFDGRVIDNPWEKGGGSFTGPSVESYTSNLDTTLKKVVDDFIDSRDELPFHYFTHFMHGAEIMGYKHFNPEIRSFWKDVYIRMVQTIHAWPEKESEMDSRLGDDKEKWMERNDPSSTCSD